MSNRELMQQALEALENSLPFHETVERLEAHNKAITALRAALKKADEDRAWVEERKANWAKDKALAQRNALEEADRIRKAGEDGRCWACGHKAEQEPICPDCKAALLYECVACSRNNYPPQRNTEQEPVAWMVKLGDVTCFQLHANSKYASAPLYTAPPQPPQQQAEPVAWMSPSKERLEFSTKSTVYGSHTIPLYTAPPQRKPLTDEEIVEAVREADLDWQAGWTLDEHEPNRFATLTRAIEEAHGIKGEV